MPSRQELEQQWIGAAEADAAVQRGEEPVAEEPVETAPEPVQEPEPPAPEPEEPPAEEEPPIAAEDPQADWIVGQLEDGTEFKYPPNLRVPLKRGEEVVYEPLEQARKERMMARDYGIKTTELRQQERAFSERVQAFELEQRRLQAERAAQEEESAFRAEASRSPEAQEEYERHLELMRTSPRYRETYERALKQRVSEAETQHFQEQERQRYIDQNTQLVQNWIQESVSRPDFQGVDPKRIEQRYAQVLLMAGDDFVLDPQHIDQLVEEEAQYLASAGLSPLQEKIASLEQQLADLQSGNAIDAHNTATEHALNRAKAPPGKPAGSPPAPHRPQPEKTFGNQGLAEANRRWANQR